MIKVKKQFSPISISIETESDLADFIEILQRAEANERNSFLRGSNQTPAQRLARRITEDLTNGLK